MAEFGQDGVEHDAAERIVLDAEQMQRPRRARRQVAVGSRHDGHRTLGRRHHDAERKNGAAAAPLRHDDVAAHGARELLDRRQPKPGAAEPRCDRDIGLRERPEQALDLAEREADATVGHREGDADLALRARAAATPASVTLPCSVNFTALSIRFSSAARSRTGSPTANAGSFSEISTDDCRPFAAARPVSESPALRASVRRSKKSWRTASPGPLLRAASTNKVARLARCSAPALMVSTQRRSRSSRSDVAKQIADRQNAGQRRAHLVCKGRQCGFDHARPGRRFPRGALFRSHAGYALLLRLLFGQPCCTP